MIATVQIHVSCALCAEELEATSDTTGELSVHPCGHCKALAEMEGAVEEYMEGDGTPAEIKHGNIVKEPHDD